MKTPPTLPGVTEIMQLAWKRVKPRYWKLIGVLLFAFCLSFPLGYWLTQIPGYPNIFFTREGQLLDWVPALRVAVPLMLLSMLIGTWGTIAARRVIMEIKTRNFFENFRFATKMLLPFLWMHFLGLAIVFLPFCFFIIPGLILLVRFWFADWVLMEGEIKGVKALATSRELVRGRFWEVLWRIFVPWTIYSFFAFVIGKTIGTEDPQQILSIQQILSSLITLSVVPFIFTYDFELYSVLKKRSPKIMAESKQTRKYKVLAILSLIIFLGWALLMAWTSHYVGKHPELFQPQTVISS